MEMYEEDDSDRHQEKAGPVLAASPSGTGIGNGEDGAFERKCTEDACEPSSPARRKTRIDGDREGQHGERDEASHEMVARARPRLGRDERIHDCVESDDHQRAGEDEDVPSGPSRT